VRVLVTGREGQLVRSLLERGAGTASEGIQLTGIGRPDLDLEDSGSIGMVIGAERPEVIINAAAYTAVDQAEDEPERAFRINAEAAGELAAAARSAGARFIQISTDYVYDGAGEGAYLETAATNPLGVYGRSKLEGEQRVLQAHPEAVVVRTAWVYSPFGKNFVKTMFAFGGQRDELSVVSDQIGNPSSALDLADGLLAVLAGWQTGSGAGSGGTYHLAGSGVTNWSELAAHVMTERAARGLPAARVRPIRTEDWPTKAARPRNSSLDTSKFERDFGYRAPDWRQSASAVIDRLASSTD
jgi:dTDP-4-dehydrorhamnose reductase